jgi:hypothetical protein
MDVEHEGGIARVGTHRTLHLRPNNVLHVGARLGVVVGQIDIFSFNLIKKIKVMYVTTCLCMCVSLLT